jgi:hypothetical protein
MRKEDLGRWVGRFGLPCLWLTLLVVWAVRLTGRFPAFLDTVTYIYPEKWVSRVQWADGVIPLWNPFIACGSPHLAQSQPACFYPPFLLWVWTGLPDAIFYMSLLHSAWALVGFFLWARRKGVSWNLSWLGAGSFAFSSIMVICWGFSSQVATIAWIPWVFLTVDRALEKEGLGAWAVFAVTLAMQTLAGYAFFSLFTFIGILVYVAWGRKASRRGWTRLALASLGAFFLCAMQVLPFIDYVFIARRILGGTFTYLPKEWVTLLWPDALGVPGLLEHRGGPGHFIFNPYFGLLPLLACLLALGSRSVGVRFFSFAALFSFFLMASLPWVPPALEILKASPVFTFFALSAAVLYLATLGKTGEAWKRWGWVFALLWALDVFLVPFRVVPLVPDPYREPENLESVSVLRQTVGEGRLLTLRPKDAYYPAGKVGSLEASIDYRVKWMSPNTNSVWGVRSVGAYLSNTVDGFQNVQRYFWGGVGNERLLDAAGVNTLMGIAPTAPKYTVSRTLADVPLTKNAGALPTVWRAAFVREFPDRPAVMQALMDPSAFVEREVFTEDAKDGKAICLPPPQRALAGKEARPYGWWERALSKWRLLWGGGNTVTPSRVTACQAEMTAEYRERGWMVWNESYAPGWRAWVDGKPQPIFRAYGLWMAVPVNGTGLRHVVFRYEPTAFRLGLFLSMVAWMLLATHGVVRFRRLGWRWPFGRGRSS